MEYTAPEVQIIAFDAEDVISESITLDEDEFWGILNPDHPEKLPCEGGFSFHLQDFAEATRQNGAVAPVVITAAKAKAAAFLKILFIFLSPFCEYNKTVHMTELSSVRFKQCDC